jgi:hypothetical protein
VGAASAVEFFESLRADYFRYYDTPTHARCPAVEELKNEPASGMLAGEPSIRQVGLSPPTPSGWRNYGLGRVGVVGSALERDPR